MQMQTTIGHAMMRAGMDRAEVSLRATIAECLKSAQGDKDKAARALWLKVKADPDLAMQAMKELLGEGQLMSARNGHPHCANVQQPEREEEARSTLPKGQPGRANSSLLAREPSAAQIGAAERAKNVISLSILDRQKTRSGGAWGNVHYHELSSFTEDAEVAREIKAHIGQLTGNDRFKQVRELVTPQQFHAILRKAGVKAA